MTESSRELLIESAKHLFARRGFDGVTVREIAEAAQLNFSLIRYYFGDKTGIYKACLEQYGRARLNSALRILEPVSTKAEFEVRLKIIIHEIIDSLFQDPDLSRMMLREMESDEPVALDVIRATMIEMAEAFITFFSSAQKNGLIRKNISPLFLTQIIQMTLSHIVLTDKARGRFFNMSIKNSMNREVLVTSLHSLILQGAMNE